MPNNNTHGHHKLALSTEALRQRLLTHSLMRPDRLPSIGRELAFALADIRQKYEQAAYGHPVTPETIHGRPTEAADPLGSPHAVDHFRERCRLIHDSRQQDAPDRAGHDLDR